MIPVTLRSVVKGRRACIVNDLYISFPLFFETGRLGLALLILKWNVISNITNILKRNKNILGEVP